MEAGRKAKPRPTKKSLDLLAPVAAVVERRKRTHPGERFAWMANKAIWELLKPMASKTELAAASACKLDSKFFCQ